MPASDRSLAGLRVLVTRPALQSAPLVQALAQRGAKPIALSAIRIVPPKNIAPLDDAARRVTSFAWVVFTSVNGVEAFTNALERVGLSVRLLAGARVAAIGPATGALLSARGIASLVVPEEHRGEAVAEAVLKAAGADIDGAKILLPRASVARDALPDILRAAGATVEVVDAYETVPSDDETRAELNRVLAQGEVDVVTFTSPSTVHHLLSALGPEARAQLAIRVLACIGPITADAVERAGLRPTITATSYTSNGLLEAIVRYSASAKSPP